MTRVTQLIHDAGKYLLISAYPLPTHPTHNFTHNNGRNLDTLPGWPRPILTQGTLVPYNENKQRYLMPEGINARVSRYYICWHSIIIVCYTFVQQLEICNENFSGVELWNYLLHR